MGLMGEPQGSNLDLPNSPSDPLHTSLREDPVRHERTERRVKILTGLPTGLNVLS